MIGLRHIASDRRGLLALAFLAALSPLAARAQGYPTRAVRVLVSYPPGGTTDILARMVADGLSKQLHQPFVVENRPGAGTAIAAQALTRAAPDGYTLLVSTGSTTALMPLLRKDLGYSPDQIAAVALIGRAPMVLDVPAKSPFKTLADLVAFGRANKDKLNVATQGAGATSHLGAELFRAKSGISFVPVHYNGSAPGLIATIAGQVDMYFDGVATSAPVIADGQLRGLAVTGDRRMPNLPDVPTMAEAGFPEVNVYSWYGLLAPAGTPAPVIELLNKTVNEIIGSPALQERLRLEGAEALPGSVPDFAKTIVDERAMWKGVITPLHLSLD